VARAQKKATTEQRTILFVDESGFYLTPGVVRTYAPKGQTPILREFLTRDHVSAISAITPAGKLYIMTQERPYTGVDVVCFVRHVLRHVPGKLLIIWDGSPIHRSHDIKEFLAAGGAERIWLERLPGYAPDLNPDEGIWRYLKRVELRNMTCPDLAHLTGQVKKAVKRLRHKAGIIRSCFGLAGLAV